MNFEWINDADYKVQLKEELEPLNGKRQRRTVWVCPYYRVWTNMKTRVESVKQYSDVTVCNEWLTFSNFKAWMNNQKWEGRELDKDLRVIGSRIYSPDTCSFIPHRVNSCLLNIDNVKGSLPKGVSHRNGLSKPFRVTISNGESKYRHIGYFENIDEAVNMWYIEKENAILETMEWWYDNDRDSFRVDIFRNVVDIARNLRFRT